MNIGKAIRKIRKEKGFSQLKLGLEIGNDSAFISKIENNKREPSVKTIVKIAEALDVHPLIVFEEFFKEEV